MKIHSNPLILILFCFCGMQLASAQSSILDMELDYGNHAIGFQVHHLQDYSRNFTVDANGLVLDVSDFRSRPIQMCLWYPAQKTDQQSMSYEDYFFLQTSEIGKMDIDVAKQQFLNDYAQVEQVHPSILKSELAVQMEAVYHAAPIKSQKFPVVVYGPSWSSTAFENAMLCEFLASHGYIVVASPSVGPVDRSMPISRIGVETQARDMEFLLSRMHTFPSADTKKVAVAGFSLGGLSNVLMLARNASIDAWIGLDPSIHEAYDFFEQSPYGDYTRFSVPTLFINSLGYIGELPFYEKLVYSDAFVINLPKLEHTDLASQFIKLYSDPKDRKVVHKRTMGYTIVAQSTLTFLDGVLKENIGYGTLRSKLWNQNIGDSTFVQRKAKKGLPQVDAIFKKFQKEKSDAIIALLNQTKSKEGNTNYPEKDLQKLIYLSYTNARVPLAKTLMQWYKDVYPNAFHAKVLSHVDFDTMLEMFIALYQDNKAGDFNYYQLNHTAQLLSMGGKGPESLKFFVLNTQLHPKNYQAYFNLGIGYYRMNDFDKAETYFEHCLKLNPDARFKSLAEEFLAKCTKT